MNDRYIKLLIFVFVLFLLSIPAIVSNFNKVSYKKMRQKNLSAALKEKEVLPPVTHIKMPENVKALYMTSFVASEPKLREKIHNLIKETNINSVVIDVKDYTGKISFDPNNDKLKNIGSVEVRVKDMREFLETLHKDGIYTIARIAVFQDPFFANKYPHVAVKDTKGLVWKDRKGLSWVDVGSKEYWDYIVLIGKETYNIGFDELNFDYIRFPSDGNMKDIVYPYSATTSKPIVLKNFFSFLHQSFKDSGVKISADIFGMTTNSKDDMGIGQVLENTIPFFDAVAPMIYPSHYPATFQGFKNPAEHPYEIITYAMKEGVDRAINASSSVKIFRPWIQDFDLGANYGEKEVREQIRALSELGINSYMIWSPSNVYTKEALDKE